ncbi:hypothetical protein [Phyllobacterium sp. UNC302MFCol5.2]|uniref:hypothetical protein n=1 Tax=Phyllobacterium sp. UNC302MFCol5.2 TaxID=1449065 RepID=UPI0009DFADCA|nr:hypothetical protein [Phyllobacterium sp. UNC302MFCol5.2]
MRYPRKSHDRFRTCTRFLVGRNLEGCWIVCDRQRLVGGLFADRESALHFAVTQSEHRPEAVWCANDDDCLLTDPWQDLTAPAPRHSKRA